MVDHHPNSKRKSNPFDWRYWQDAYVSLYSCNDRFENLNNLHYHAD